MEMPIMEIEISIMEKNALFLPERFRGITKKALEGDGEVIWILEAQVFTDLLDGHRCLIDELHGIIQFYF